MNIKEVRELTGWKLGTTHRLIIKELLDRGGSVEKLEKGRFKLSYGKKSYIIRRGIISNSYNTRLAQRCTNMKEVTSRLLRSRGFNSPENTVFNSTEIDRAWAWAKSILPVVLKPSNSMMGKLVFVKIDNYDDFKECFEKISEEYNEVLIEQFVKGEEYRFTFLNGKILAVANRVPANVIGDGVSTITELVKEKNLERKRRKNIQHKRLKLDEESLRVLTRIGYDFDSVPKENETVYLRNNSNVSTGGDAIDVTDEIDQVIKDEVAAAMKSIPGLRICGIDVLINENEYYILEINSYAMLTMHHFPWEGKPRNIIGPLVEDMFPELEKVHIRN